MCDRGSNTAVSTFDKVDDTIEELYLLLLIIITGGAAYLLHDKKRVYENSYIHACFKFIDFFDVRISKRFRRLQRL